MNIDAGRNQKDFGDFCQLQSPYSDSAFAASPQAFTEILGWEIDLETNEMRWLTSPESPALQFAGSNLTLKKSLKAIHPQDRKKVLHSVRKLLRLPGIQTVQARVALTTGGYYPAHIQCSKCLQENYREIISCILRKPHPAEPGHTDSFEKAGLDNFIARSSVFPLALHRDGTILTVNSLACKTLGGEKTEDFIGKKIFDFVHPSSWELISIETDREKQFFDSLREGQFIRLDDTVIDVEVINSKVLYQGKEASQVFFRDISSRKQSEILQSVLFNISQAASTAAHVSDLLRIIHHEISRLMDARNFFTSIYEAQSDTYTFPYFIDDYDPAPNFPIKILKTSMTDYVRRQGQAMLLRKDEREQLINEGKIDRVGHDPMVWMGVPFSIVNNVEGVVAVQSYEDEFCYSKKDLEVLTFVSQHIAFALQKKRAEEELRFRELRFRALTEKVQDLVLILSRYGKCLYASPSLQRFGYSVDELLNTQIDKIVDRQDHRKAVNKLRAVEFQDNESIYIDELKVLCKNGDIRTIEGVMTILLDQPGVNGIVFNGRDITRRKLEAEAKRKLEQQMQHTQKLESLGILAGGIAHDFNNLLVAVLGNADMVLSELDANSLMYENVKEIEKAAFRAADLCKQMLAYSGRGNFIIDDLNLTTVLRDMVQMLEASRSKKAIINLNLTESIPNIHADITQVRQVILNLLTNASDALEDREGVVILSTGYHFFDSKFIEGNAAGNKLKAGKYIFLEVQDTGCGMDSTTVSKLFDPFFTTKFTGRGLGLSAVLGIMRGHKGGIIVESTPGQGSTFTVLFPPAPGPGIKTQEYIVKKNKLKQGEGTILVADDEQIVRDMARKILSRKGYSIIEAINGDEAIDLVHKNHADLCCILLDMTMPKMDGKQVIRKIRKYTRSIPVILTSGFSEMEISLHFAGEKIAGFLQKPFTVDALSQLIDQVVDC